MELDQLDQVVRRQSPRLPAATRRRHVAKLHKLVRAGRVRLEPRRPWPL